MFQFCVLPTRISEPERLQGEKELKSLQGTKKEIKLLIQRKKEQGHIQHL